MPERHRILVGCWIATVAYVGVTACYLEWANARAGFVMPQALPGKARYAIWTDEHMWRQVLGPRDAEGNPVTRPLNTEEASQMRSDIQRAITHNRLTDGVRTWGLWQYPIAWLGIVLTAGVWCAEPWGRTTRLVILAGLPVLLAGLALAYYRGYFSFVID